MGAVRISAAERKTKAWDSERFQKTSSSQEDIPREPRTDIGSFVRRAQTIKQSQGQSETEADLTETAEKCFAYLRKQYPGIHFSLVILSGEEVLTKYAQTAGAGSHFAVDIGFLKKMMADPDTFQRGLGLLEKAAGILASGQTAHPSAAGRGALAGADGSISFWALEQEKQETVDPMQAILDSMKSQQQVLSGARQKSSQSKMTVKKKLDYSAYRDLMMLARTGTEQSVRSLIVRVYANVLSIKREKDQYGEDAVRSAQAQMEGVILRAKMKVKHLQKEGIEKQRIKKSEQQRKLEKARRLKAELQKRRAARRSREYGQVNDFHSVSAKSREEEQQERQALAEALLSNMSGSTGATVPTASTGAESAPSSTGGGDSGGSVVVVSTSMDLSI